MAWQKPKDYLTEQNGEMGKDVVFVGYVIYSKLIQENKQQQLGFMMPMEIYTQTNTLIFYNKMEPTSS